MKKVADLSATNGKSIKPKLQGVSSIATFLIQYHI